GYGQGLQIWAAFIAWGCFYHCGGKEAGLRSSIVGNIFGAVIAWICLIVATSTNIGNALPAGLWAGIVVGVGVFVLVIAANMPAFSTIPASVYGFAATAGYALVGGHVGASLYTASLADNPLIAIVVSMVIGAVLGYISEKVG